MPLTNRRAVDCVLGCDVSKFQCLLDEHLAQLPISSEVRRRSTVKESSSLRWIYVTRERGKRGPPSAHSQRLFRLRISTRDVIGVGLALQLAHGIHNASRTTVVVERLIEEARANSTRLRKGDGQRVGESQQILVAHSASCVVGCDRSKETPGGRHNPAPLMSATSRAWFLFLRREKQLALWATGMPPEVRASLTDAST